MKQIFLFLIGALAWGTLGAQAQSEIQFTFQHQAEGVPMVLNQTVFSIWNGKKVLLTRAEFYLSKIELTKDDNTKLPLTDRYLLVQANKPDTTLSAGSWPVQQIRGLNLFIGVDAEHNHLDPATFPATHPLSPQEASMHWGWTAGYRFMAIEGRVDNNGDGIPESVFQWHNLGDALYTGLKIGSTIVAQNGKLTIPIQLDYSKLFNTLDLDINLVQHGSSALNALMMMNASGQGFLKLATTSSTAEDNADAQIEVRPNPADQNVLLEYSNFGKGPLHLSLCGTTGQVLRQYKQLPEAGAFRLETAGLPNGLYRLVFRSENGWSAHKTLLVQH
ncbi:MAG: hypothetical protein IT260_07170 [Saprospiraceae bacterium]|nr:hypothetical protein [Saprospiraceae bacterium]